MRVLVTGGAGYIGSHIVKGLARDGYEIFVLDNLSKGHRGAVTEGVFIEGDLSDAPFVGGVLKGNGIEAVIHMAADSLVGESMSQPAKYYRNNISNGCNLLGAMIKNNIFKIVFSSTAAVYGEPESYPINEDFPLQPTNVYGRTKLFFEAILKDYALAYGLNSVSLRYFNAAGADESGNIGEDHDPETHLIPLVLQTVLGQREAIDIFGIDYPTPDGTCIRDYIHVTDLARAHILALNALKETQGSVSYNLGSGQGYSVKEIINVSSAVTGKNIPVREVARRAGDPAVLVASSEKIKQDLGWQPQLQDIYKIVETAWHWHERNPSGFVEIS